ncbi:MULTISPECIES: hypothetical protein [unclassified Devosia]|uniref:hypothetical protein n=1 Tax=unclassified Devosia TaxID=196773 RepID=UPI001AC3C0FE|nr:MULTISPECIES: hypothetical protein [unclassified Devosia]MBN9305638.1 hypothetical protein [Devosia sp.]
MSDLTALTRRVRPILLKTWDPIGIADEPRAQDEYDAYAPAIARMLAADVSEAALASHLLAVERDRMGLRGDEQRAAQTAKLLLALVKH